MHARGRARAHASYASARICGRRPCVDAAAAEHRASPSPGRAKPHFSTEHCGVCVACVSRRGSRAVPPVGCVLPECLLVTTLPRRHFLPALIADVSHGLRATAHVLLSRIGWSHARTVFRVGIAAGCTTDGPRPQPSGYALQVASDMLDVARCVASACCWMLHANARALCACAATAAAPGDILRAAAKHRARNLADRTLCGYSVRTLHVALLTLRRAFSCCLRTQPVPSSALPMLARPRHHSAPTARTVPQSPHGPPQYRPL